MVFVTLHGEREKGKVSSRLLVKLNQILYLLRPIAWVKGTLRGSVVFGLARNGRVEF